VHGPARCEAERGCQTPPIASRPTPVVFVHGLWLHSTSWDPWVQHFNGQGYPATAPPWPGESDTVEETRKNPDAIAGHGIDDVVEHYAGAIAELGPGFGTHASSDA
jgi:pimeloyl-ACP methyl ester carboxylesterase